jgi:DNA-binding response OmpR family regulator
VAGRKMDDEDIVFNCVRLFKVTRQQASLLSVLIRRNEVSKDMMHQIIEKCRAPNKGDQTDPKMVDVVICNLRKRLRDHGTGLKIETMWGCGYFMKPDMRTRALEMIGAYATGVIVKGKS